MKVKPGMSDYQRRPCLNSEKKETQNSGEKKLSLLRKEIDEIKELAIMHPLRIKQRKREGNDQH
jgi:hypothetical protein